MTQAHLSRRAFQAALLGSGLATASAQPFTPGKAITLVVGYPPGGSVDLVARTLGDAIGQQLGVSVIIDNVGGAGGTIGAQKVISAAPDGHTLLLGSGSEVSIARLFNSAIKYDGQTDLAHLGLVGTTSMVWVASPRMGVKTVTEALGKIRAEKGKTTFASSGVGTPLHIAGELINLGAGVDMRHVPYRGAAQMVQDVLGGNVDMAVFVISSAKPHIDAGKMVALAVTTPQRSRVLPSVASISDTVALKNYNMNVWFGLFGPAKLPQALQTRFNTALNAALKQPEVWRRLEAAGISNEGGSQRALSAFIAAETTRVRTVVKQVLAGGAT